jgi:outer membrane receptor protein involved in Fe transport
MVGLYRDGICLTALALGLCASAPALAQNAPVESAIDASPADGSSQDIIVTGSRIPRTDLTSTSPIAMTGEEDIKLQSALTVEDFSVRLPQLAGGVRQAAQGSDAFGAQVLDLRNFGQSRSLVMINGSRAVPFSFRNSVDVNAIPASLIKRVDVLTGGAAAVYGADAVAGVVNFILQNDFEGLQASVTGRASEDGGRQYGLSMLYGTKVGGDRGNLVIAADYTRREQVLAGERSWAVQNLPIPNPGGVFTDIASGRRFGYDASGQFTLTPPASINISDRYPLIVPLKRLNVAALWNFQITPVLEVYGRALYTNVRSQESGTPGPNPPAINQTVSISQTNPFLTQQIRDQLTFVNGAAQVGVNRSLLELGLITYNTERNTSQFQLGFRGPITDNIKWDVYGQYGRSTESSPITGDGLVTNAAGQNIFASIVNTVDIFGPNRPGIQGAIAQTIQGFNRKRDQLVALGTLSGTTADVFSLPAGPIGFAVGLEYRRETGRVTQDTALITGNSFRQGSQAAFASDFEVTELYGELLVPILKDTPFFKALDVGGAYRISDYDRFGQRNTWKVEANWALDDNVRFRGTYQRVIRTPNFGEFAAGVSSLPFNALVTVPRLAPRYGGDPCVLGTGNVEQCRRFNAPAQGSANSFDPAFLEGRYFFGGNPDIEPEVGKTKTVGVVLTPEFLPGFTATVDWYELDLRGAIGVIQPINSITSCYITDPRADNPLCALVTRNPANGRFVDAFVNNQNLGRLTQRGLDINVNYRIQPTWIPGDGVTLSYAANVVTSYIFQPNATVAPIQCKGTFGATCSSDATTLVQPDYRHDASITWDFGPGSLQFNWQRIGEVRNSAPNTADKLAAQNYFDLSGSYSPLEWLTVSGGVYNLFDKKPPFVAGGAFNTFPDTYDVLGRTYGLSLTARF